MIIYSKEPFKPNMKNIIMLDAGMTDGYIYVSKDTYEQAVAVGVTFSKDHERVERALGKMIDGWKITPGIFTVFRKAAESLPEPINILCTFIGLASNAGLPWKADASEEEMCELVCGVLHTISQFADFYSMTLLPPEQRTKLDIPNHVYKGYRESWNSLINDLDSHTVSVTNEMLEETVKAVVEKSIGETIDNKIKEGLSNISIPSTPEATGAATAEVDTTQLESIIDRIVTEKINAFVNTELPMLISKQMPTGNQAMPNYQQMATLAPFINPYMFQQPYITPPVVPQPTPQPTQPTQPAPQPVQPTQPVEATPVSQPTTSTVSTANENIPDSLKNAEIVEGENVVDPNEIADLIASINAEYDELLEQEQSKLEADNSSTTAKAVEPEEPKVLTEDVRKEMNIAAESQKIINSYDL